MHFGRHGANLPLRTLAHTQVEKVPQLPCIHRNHQAGFTCAGKHEACILVAALASPQLFLPAGVPSVHLFHLRLEFRLGLRTKSGDLRGYDVPEALLVGYIALALHREAGQPMPGQLGQQHPAYALHAKGEAGVLQHGFVTHVQQTFHTGLLILCGDLLLQIANRCAGIAQPRTQRHHFLGG